MKYFEELDELERMYGPNSEYDLTEEELKEIRGPTEEEIQVYFAELRKWRNESTGVSDCVYFGKVAA